MNILGIAFLSDASAAVLRDGKLVSAVSEERLNRIKQWNGVPRLAVQAALKTAGLTMDDIDLIATHGDAPPEPDPEPFQEKERAICAADLPPERREEQVATLRKRLAHERMVLGTRTPDYISEVRALGKPVRVVGHHEAHAATAYFGSGWDECMVLTADGWGEDGSSTIWVGKQGKLFPRSMSYTFDSLGYFYGSITKSLGFVPHRHEGKVLGLAAHRQAPKSYGPIRSMIDYDSREKRFVGRMEAGMYIPQFDNPFLKEFVKNYPREDIAAAAQQSVEEVVCDCVADLDGAQFRIALAGGLFANVKLNQRVAEVEKVREVYVFPCMGDGGLSVGAAWQVYAQETGRRPEPMTDLFLGPRPTDAEIGEALAESSFRYTHVSDIEERIAAHLADGRVVVRCCGGMEFGPRALGNRSVLYQANDPSVNDWLNRHLRRSEFMPFAPATLAEHADDYYEGLEKGGLPSRYMAVTFSCTPKMRAEASGAVHVDGTARPQIVSPEEYPEFHRILAAYHKRTGNSHIINTSFNMHEEPIVSGPQDALRAFRASGLPFLAVGNFWVEADEDVL